MISIRWVVVGAVAVLAAGCGGERAGGDAVRLRFGPPAGTTQHYAIEQHTTMRFEGGPMEGMGQQQVTMRMFVTQTVTGPTEGGTGVTLTFDSTRLESPGMPVAQMDAALQRMRGLTGHLVVDERMKVVGATFQPVPGLPRNVGEQLGSTVRGLVFPFPAGPVGVGDSWTEEIELPLGQLPGNPGPVRSRTTLTLREIRVEEGDSLVVLDVVSTMPKDPIRVRVESQEATIHLDGTLEGDQVFSLTRGMPRSAAMAGAVRMTMSGGIPGAGEMALILDQRIDMRTLGGP